MIQPQISQVSQSNKVFPVNDSQIWMHDLEICELWEMIWNVEWEVDGEAFIDVKFGYVLILEWVVMFTSNCGFEWRVVLDSQVADKADVLAGKME